MNANVSSFNAAISADEREEMLKELAICDKQAVACSCGAASIWSCKSPQSCIRDRKAANDKVKQLREKLGVCKECGDEGLFGVPCPACGRGARRLGLPK
eukprot:1712623-Karenia_brevis.AAC.1